MTGTVQALEAGRDAIRRRAWDEALETFSTLDRDEGLTPEDLELLADAAWWAGRPDDAVEALERAYAGYVGGEMAVDAARVALVLAYLAVRRLAFSVAGGWRARATRLLEGLPESPVHAQLAILGVAEAFQTDLSLALERADETLALARRTGNRDVEAEVLAFKGHALASSGRWDEGLAVIDEAVASALSGGLSLRSISHVYCITIATCFDVADYGRANEWTAEAERWMSGNAVGGYPGACQVHHAELKRLAGAWPEAEEEARQACDNLRRYRILDSVGPAYHEIGEIRLRMGDLEGAEAAFRSAYENGFYAQSGMALLLLAKGQPEEAARALARALDGGAGGADPDLTTRARLLPAQVEVAVASGDVGTAEAAAGELERIAADFGRPAFEADARSARAQVALLRGDAAGAVPHLDRALRLWRDLGFPYEVARTRVLLARARLELGDGELARIDLEAARSAFAELGAVPDVRRVDGLLHGLRGAEEPRARVTRTFMFTDIVTSTDLVGLIGDAAWESLLAWHDRQLRSLFAEHGGIEVSHTGDGFFVAFDDSGRAVEAAVAVQRRLADHRREHGFSPTVRIGIHRAEATVEGEDYRGQGVHVAARVGAAAGGEEILVSAGSLAGVTVGHPVSEGREVELKGVRDPVVVHAVDWR